MNRNNNIQKEIVELEAKDASRNGTKRNKINQGNLSNIIWIDAQRGTQNIFRVFSYMYI